MIKECPVIMNNDAVTVVRFDGIDIQFPSVKREGVKTLNVKFENGIYSIVDSAEKEADSHAEKTVKTTEQTKNKSIKKKAIKTEPEETFSE